MGSHRDSSDEIEKAREYEKKLIDATRFCKSFKTYLEEHAPQVFDEDGEIDRLKLGYYCVDLRNSMFTQQPKLTEFERLIVKLSFTKVPEKCNVCGKQISPTHISRLNELLGPRICDSCILKPGIKEIMQRVDPDETVVFWRDWYRDLSTQERTTEQMESGDDQDSGSSDRRAKQEMTTSPTKYTSPIDKEIPKIFDGVFAAIDKIREKKENNDTHAAINGQGELIHVLAYALEFATRMAKQEFEFDDDTINKIIRAAKYGVTLEFVRADRKADDFLNGFLAELHRENKEKEKEKKEK